MVQQFPALEAGDHLDQRTFHARYEAMPKHVRAELIGGVVYMSSPLKARHGRYHQELNYWLLLYNTATPATDLLDNSTTILGEHGEPQPDTNLLILPEYGGQTHEDENGFIVGAPELIAEVADSSESYDLHSKRRDYEQAGVREYVVLLLREMRVAWWVRREQGFVPLEPGADGILRSEWFGGLWLDPEAIFRRDRTRVKEVLEQGLASADYAQFIERLKRS